jgi:DNA-binding transcriptional MerR regulator
MSLSNASAPKAATGAEFLIGELARRTGRSVHAIRWYESLGLVPGVRRDGGNRRVYNERHVGWLDLVHRLRTTGMTIAQMRVYAALVQRGRGTSAEQRALLLAHRARVETTIAEWHGALALLDRKLALYAGQLAAAPAAPVLKQKGKRP